MNFVFNSKFQFVFLLESRELFNVQDVANIYMDTLCEPNFIYRRQLPRLFYLVVKIVIVDVIFNY